jgi:hypothetical protein
MVMHGGIRAGRLAGSGRLRLMPSPLEQSPFMQVKAMFATGLKC